VGEPTWDRQLEPAELGSEPNLDEQSGERQSRTQWGVTFRPPFLPGANKKKAAVGRVLGFLAVVLE
jgi:hypothetical protein